MKVKVQTGQTLVTEISLHLTRRPPILAFVDVTLWNTIVVRDLRLLERQDRTRVLLMPRLQGSDGQWVTMAHPIREDTRAEIEAVVMDQYRQAEMRRRLERHRRERPVETPALS